MRIASQLCSWWRAIVHRSRIDSEVEGELQFHLEAYTEDLILGGLSPGEAARRAKIEFGRPDVQWEKYITALGLEPWHELGSDVRYATRSLFKNPGFSVVAVLSLALGIGATTAMFSLVYAVLIHPFPYINSDRIMNPVIINEERPDEYRWFATYKAQFELLRRAKAIENLLGFRNVNAEITGNELPEDVAAIYLTENSETFFGVRALLGRGIQPSDAQGSGQRIVVLNYKFWQRHFRGDPAVIGRTLQLDRANYVIVGVMPRSFAFNDTLGVGDIYLPRSLLHDSINPPLAWPYTPWIKLKANVTMAEANAELGAIVQRFAKELPQRYPKNFHLKLQPIIGPYAQDLGHTLALLLAGVLLLLVIGCANCSILLLARSEGRRHELAVRSALGAGRWRIIRQLLVESLILSFTGALLGIAASYWLAALPLRLFPQSFPSESVIRINLPILAFSLGLALCCGLLFGLAPALRLSRPDVAGAMQSSLRRIAGHGAKHRVNILIAGQIALTLILMATAGSAIGTLIRLTKIPLGYDPKNVMQAGIVMHWDNQRDWQGIQSTVDRAAFIDRVRQRIASVPGITSVAVGTDSTPPYSGVERTIDISDRVSGEEQEARIHLVSPEYFATLRVPLVRGRIWDEAENARGDFVAIVNESLAQHYWPHQTPIGKRLRIPSLKSDAPLIASSPESAAWRQVIGVVGDTRNDGIDKPVVPAIYLPYTTLMAPYAQYEIRTQSEPLAFLRSVRVAVQSVASDQQVSNGSYDLQEAIERDSQWSRQRLLSILFGFFSTMALALSLVGLFSVVSYGVEQRTVELGVRMALGAPRSHILWIAGRTAALSVSCGIAIGLLINLLLGKLLAHWMNGTSHAGGGFLEIILLLVVCACLACLQPALRAVSLHPIDALRCE